MKRKSASDQEIDALLAARPRPQLVKRAIGIVRVSATRGREGESFASPREQRAQIERICQQNTWALVEVFEELDVSAYSLPLHKRPGLSQAVRQIEAGEIDVVVVAYFDRLFRKLKVQLEAVERVEKAGGELYSADLGQLSHGTASRRLTTRMLGMISEYYSELLGEKTREAKIRAVARGVAPWGVMPLGYVVDRSPNSDRRIHVDPAAAAVVREAFERREAGSSLNDVCVFLRERGYPRSFRSVQKMVINRFYLGELHYGDFPPLLNSHEAIIDGRLFRSCAGMRAGLRGRQIESPNLLARQGLVRCGTCGGKMMAGGQNLTGRVGAPRKRYYDYRCVANVSPGCPRRPYISADRLDAYVADYAKCRLVDLRGQWSDDQRVFQAEADVADKRVALNAAVAAFDGVNVEATRAKLLELQESLEQANERMETLRAAFGTAALASLDNWDAMKLRRRREILRAFIDRIVIAPGRGTLEQRVSIEPFEK